MPKKLTPSHPLSAIADVRGQNIDRNNRASIDQQSESPPSVRRQAQIVTVAVMAENDETDAIEKYRGRAEDMRLRAALARNPHVRDIYDNIAADYEEMAEGMAIIQRTRLAVMGGALGNGQVDKLVHAVHGKKEARSRTKTNADFLRRVPDTRNQN